jgi:Cu(I)/Ag(I) efflux system membrane fusion protein
MVARDALTVPEDAIVDTGTRQLVYVALPGGRFRPVEARIGHRGDGRVEILAGIREADDVVVAAQFLLDSESRLRGTTGGEPAHGGH